MSSSTDKPALKHATADQRYQSELANPTIIGAIYDEDHQGLLPISALTKPVRVELSMWHTGRSDDTYQLLWNHVLVGELKKITTEELGANLFLGLPDYLLQKEGIHNICYRTFNARNGTHTDSPPVRLEIDLTPPGLPQLQPIKFPEQVANGLTSGKLTAMGNQLVGEVAPYTDMYQHDVIRTYWGDIEGPSVVVNRGDVAASRVEITCTREFLESLGDFNGMVTYTAMDRAGNISEQSLGTPLRASVIIPENFPAPIIDPTLGTLIDYAEACRGVLVDIPHYPDAAVGDQITLYWEGIALAAQPVAALHEHASELLPLIVPYSITAAKPQGLAHARYEVHRDGQLFGSSLQSSIEVFVSWPGPDNLAAPVIQGAGVNPNTLDNFIDEDDYELNSRALIQWNRGFAVNDELTLHWGHESIVQWYQVTASDISAQQDLLIPIPQAIMKIGGTGSQIPVFYTLSRLGNPNPSKSPVQRVIVRRKRLSLCSCHCPVIYSDSTVDITA